MVKFSYYDLKSDPEQKDYIRIKTGECDGRVVRIMVWVKNDKEVLGYNRAEFDDQLRDYFGLSPLPRARIY